MARRIKLSEIKIKDSYFATIPSEEKIDECRHNYLTYGRQDRYIVINGMNELIDGYVMYLVLKDLGIEEAEIKISHCKKKRWYRKNIESWEVPYYRNNSTIYVFGKHPNSKDDREYVWRVPNKWIGWADDLSVGDLIICETKHGRAPVIVTRIEELDKCPVDMMVKRVVKKVVRLENN